MATPARVILDTDPGIDDVLALAIAARAPELEIVGVVTVFGNGPLSVTTRNARHLLALAGVADVVVTPGSDRPLSRDPDAFEPRHGLNAVGYASVPPDMPVTANPIALLEVMRSSEPMTLVTLGPMTNLARAIERDASLVHDRVQSVVSMLGNFGPPTTPDRYADFNGWSDPEAVDRVLRAELPLVVVPRNVTVQCALSDTTIARWAAAADPLVRWLSDALRFGLPASGTDQESRQRPIHDVVAVAALLDPGIMTLAKRRLTINLDEGPLRGHTREHAAAYPVHVATHVDADAVRTIVERLG
jgi:inosine-uridine nucleoside N-ribohydrolase